jgi:hypothetical protein
MVEKIHNKHMERRMIAECVRQLAEWIADLNQSEITTNPKSPPDSYRDRNPKYI